MEVTGTELIFATLAVSGVISIARGILWFSKPNRDIAQSIFCGGAGLIAVGAGIVDLLASTLYWTPQSMHLFIFGCVVLGISVIRSMFGTAFILGE